MKANQQLVFQWLFTLGLIGAALMLTVVIGSPSSLSGMPLQYSYNLLAIKSRCLHYLCGLWSLLVCKEEAPVILNSRNLFLLVNLIIVLILSSVHLQRHAAASAAVKARKKSRTSDKEKLEIFRVDSSRPLHGSSPSSSIEKEEYAAAAAMASDESPDQACMETISNGISAAAMSDLQTDSQAFKEEISPSEELDTAGSASMDTLPAKYYPGPPAAGTANDNEPACGALDQDGPPAKSRVEGIVLEEDGRLQMIEMPRGSKAQKNENGRLGYIERALPPASRRKQVSAQRKPQPQSSDANCSSDANSSYITNSRDTKSDSYVSGNDSHIDRNAYHSSDGLKDLSVPKSISLNRNDLLSDHQKVKSSETNFARSRVKSMDASDISRKKQGKKNVVKRAFGLRREPSITSQEELNARVESFIAKFNENMKIQRQQSLLSYMQMVDRGA